MPQSRIGEDGKAIICSDLYVDAVAIFHKDGSLKCVDINCIEFQRRDVTSYILQIHTEKWDEVKAAAETYYLDTYENIPTP